MSRRTLCSLRILLYIAVAALFLYGYYAYHDLQSELKIREDREERVKRQLDTVSSELESTLLN